MTLISFNPSQVQFTQDMIVGVVLKSLSFNPSQVQFTLLFTFQVECKTKKFQSLTGSIHTGLNILSGWIETVSIPHRFNSHIEIEIVKVVVIVRFNPSQVQFTLISFRRVCMLMHCFNPSQVQFTLISFNSVGGYGNSFQSLTGSIHTFGS